MFVLMLFQDPAVHVSGSWYEQRTGHGSFSHDKRVETREFQRSLQDD